MTATPDVPTTPGDPQPGPLEGHAGPSTRTTFTVTCRNQPACGQLVTVPNWGVTLNLAAIPATYQFVCPACLRTSTAYPDRTTVAVIQSGNPERVLGDPDSRVDAERMGWEIYGDDDPPAWPAPWTSGGAA